MLTPILFLLGGLALLIVGAEALVSRAARMAQALGLSPLIIGLTVVAFGTSAPELAISLTAAASGQPSISLGNIIGSNILNILLILGLAALISPLIISEKLVRLDVTLMVSVSVLVFVLGLDGRISQFDGILLFGGLIAYIIFMVRQNRLEKTPPLAEGNQSSSEALRLSAKAWVFNSGIILISLVLLVQGSNWLILGATSFAQSLGLSELVIGLTVIAVGTSLPEIATSVIASLRGQRDIAVGNVIGSNLFNLLLVLGLSSLLTPNGIPLSEAVLGFDLPIMIATAFACLPIFVNGYRIDRWEGALFLVYYFTYTAYLILSASQHDLLPRINLVMVEFVLPITAVTLIIILVRGLNARRPSSQS
jgi:cation:H+ antiporter